MVRPNTHGHTLLVAAKQKGGPTGTRRKCNLDLYLDYQSQSRSTKFRGDVHLFPGILHVKSKIDTNFGFMSLNLYSRHF